LLAPDRRRTPYRPTGGTPRPARGPPRGVTGERLAAAWGLSVDYLKKIAAEASRRVLDAIDPAAVRLRLAHAFGRSVDVLEGKLDGPDALEAARALPGNATGYAALVGADAPKRREYTIVEALNHPDYLALKAQINGFLRFEDADLKSFLEHIGATEDYAEWRAKQGRVVGIKAACLVVLEEPGSTAPALSEASEAQCEEAPK
jgi:hypothetical protein